MSVTTRAIGAPFERIDGPEKVKGTARYAFEQPVEQPAYLYPLQAAIAAGQVTRFDGGAALAEPGVLALLRHENAPKLPSAQDPELAILQSEEVNFRGQLLGGVVAETPEAARYAASLVRLEYRERPHEVELKRTGNHLYAPQHVNPTLDTDTARGDLDTALESAAFRLDATYTTAMYFHNSMEPHTTIAIWGNEGITLYVSSQGVHWVRQTVASTFGFDPERVHVISPHVGGGFGSKAFTHADVILAAMAARLVAGRPVKLALTRQQTFSLIGYRTPTIQRLQLAADAEGHLTAITHDVIEQTAKIKEFAEQTAVATRMMYAAPNRRTTHRLAALDVQPPTIMRAPGEAPGMFALESAMDEMAVACGLDPVEFRIRNEPPIDPESGLPFSSRNLVACLRAGARRFEWQPHQPGRGARTDRGWMIGTGVAASTYPVFRLPGSVATIRVVPGGRYIVRIGAADIGTGTWTALTQIAADALAVRVEDVELQIGDSALPPASVAGGSSGITCWGSTIIEAARKLDELRAEYVGTIPAEGLEVTSQMPDNPYVGRFSMHSFGAQFVEVRVNQSTGEVRVPRLLGVFAAGRIINPKTARSQMIGGMTMGLSMALHEDGVLDPRCGYVVNQDLAEYHIASNADVNSIEVDWVDEEDPYSNPMGSKGVGELGIVGTAAAIANAVYDATGIRVRDLPITLDKLLQ
jgi:xanthine dehydrogenase YagR molybdenum-binding subunit